MKKFIVVLSAILTIPAFAGEVTKPQQQERKEQRQEERVEDIKAKVIEQMDKHIQLISEAKKCVQNSKTHDDLRQCRDSMKENRKVDRTGR